ncbi:MAG: hypothetical protein K4571_16305 [Deltaproteobacteria bacterium]
MMTANKQSGWTSRLIAGLLFICLAAAGCTGGDPSDGVHIYAVGSAVVNDIHVPVYWQDGRIVELSRPDAACPGYANSIVVAGKDIHIAGTTFVCGAGDPAETPVAAYWKNGIRTDLERPAAHTGDASEAQQLIIAGGKVYIAGYVTGDAGPVPVYWEDGQLVYLNEIPYGGTRARASNIFVDGRDIYVSGAALFDTAYPVYWKNGEATTLPLPGGYSGTSVPLPIRVANGDIYVFGHLHHLRTPSDWDTSERPVYWKNGELVPLFPLDNGAGYSYGGTVFNGVPYSAGAYVEGVLYTPAFWSDHTKVSLPMIDPELYGMAHDVLVNAIGAFVAGWSYRSMNPADPEALLVAVPCYWIAGVRVDLPALTTESAFAREIFVTP